MVAGLPREMGGHGEPPYQVVEGMASPWSDAVCFCILWFSRAITGVQISPRWSPG